MLKKVKAKAHVVVTTLNFNYYKLLYHVRKFLFKNYIKNHKIKFSFNKVGKKKIINRRRAHLYSVIKKVLGFALFL